MQDQQATIAHYQGLSDDELAREYANGPTGFRDAAVWEAIAAEHDRRGLHRGFQPPTVVPVALRVGLEITGWVTLGWLLAVNPLVIGSVMFWIGLPAAFWFRKKSRPMRWGFLAGSNGVLPLLFLHVMMTERERRAERAQPKDSPDATPTNRSAVPAERPGCP